jgi:toxin YoeB
LIRITYGNDFLSSGTRRYCLLEENRRPEHSKKISSLLKDILKHPYNGIGKPEALKYQLAGMWSRRINAKHRLVYRIKDDQILIETIRGHY